MKFIKAKKLLKAKICFCNQVEQAVKREVGGSVKAVVTRLGVGQEEEVGMELENA